MESRWMDTRAGGLHWREGGEGRPMVFLHGLADSHRSFAPLSEAFADRRTLLLDLPGHGLSDRPDAPYTPEWYGEVVGDWWDRLGLEDVDLVAHSYGGAVAQLMLLSHRAQVRSLTLIAPGGLGPDVGFGLRLMTLPYAEHVIAPFLGPGMNAVLRQVGVAPPDAGESGWMGTRPGSARAVVRTARAAIDLGGQYRGVYERVHEVEDLPPTVLLWGDRDPIIPARQVADVQRWLRDVDVRMYAGAQHWPHIERRPDVTRDLRELLDREDRRRVTVSMAHVPRVPSPARRAARFFANVGTRLAAAWRAFAAAPSAPA